MPLEPIHKKTFVLMNKNVFERKRKVPTLKYLYYNGCRYAECRGALN